MIAKYGPQFQIYQMRKITKAQKVGPLINVTKL